MSEPSEMKTFTDALYLQGKLTALLGLDPDASASEVEAAVKTLQAALVWKTGTPDVGEGKIERFWCAVRNEAAGKIYHRPLEYANRHAMPIGEGLEPSGDAEEVPGSEGEEYYWTGWFEPSCDQCDTQWAFSGHVVAWMRLPRWVEGGTL